MPGPRGPQPGPESPASMAASQVIHSRLLCRPEVGLGPDGGEESEDRAREHGSVPDLALSHVVVPEAPGCENRGAVQAAQRSGVCTVPHASGRRGPGDGLAGLSRAICKTFPTFHLLRSTMKDRLPRFTDGPGGSWMDRVHGWTAWTWNLGKSGRRGGGGRD